MKECRSTRKSALCALLLLLNGMVLAQDLFVCKVHGRVKLDTAAVKVGDKIKVNDKRSLRFSSAQDYVAVVSPQDGRFMLSPAAAQQENQLTTSIKEALVIGATAKPSYPHSSGDAGIKTFLGNGKLAMLDSIRIPLDASYLEYYRSQVFVITYKTTETSVEKVYRMDPLYPFLVIDRWLFFLHGTYLNPDDVSDVVLSLRDNEFGLTREISRLKVTDLRYSSTLLELRSAYAGLVQYSRGDEKKLEAELRAHVGEYYGEIDQSTLTRLLPLLK